jgi:L-threonylcarbamoyladenylate synthase
MSGNVVPASPAAIRRGGEILAAGGLVAFPTETVYGLGADATNDRAVARIFAAKGRPAFNPLIVHIQGSSEGEKLAQFTPSAWRLTGSFWPAGLTLVLKRRPDCPVSRLASAGLETIAIRAPEHSLARDLLIALGRPIAAPSANPSGRLTPTRAEHVAAGLGDKVDLIIDGGASAGGIESTVLDLSGEAPRILRAGLVPREALEAALGTAMAVAGAGDAIAAPGMLAQHYAPQKRLRLDAVEVRPGEALLAFGGAVPAGAAETLNLSPSGDLVEAAANLFAFLHRLDAGDAARIAVMPIPERGLGAAINDRLRRAATAPE